MGLTFNNITAASLGVFVERVPDLNGGAHRYSTYTVPGRNGAIVQDDGGMDNVTQEYEVAVVGDAPAAARRVRQWLLAPSGYCRLEDDYDAGYFRLAYFVGPVQVENILQQAGRASIAFSCRPERWLTTGEETTEYTEAATVENPTENTALPIIRIYNDGAEEGTGTVTVNDREITATIAAGGYIELDCERMDAAEEGQNRNDKITVGDAGWPVLEAGENEVSFTGDISRVEITPRWWVY